MRRRKKWTSGLATFSWRKIKASAILIRTSYSLSRDELARTCMHSMQIYKRSLLHVAAWFGDLVCVKWLVEHGALLNTSDAVNRFSSCVLLSLLFLQFGEWPLMAACASLIDAPLKVRYLAEAGADYLAQGPVSFRVAFSMQLGAS